MPDIGCMPSRGCRPDIGCKYGVDVGPGPPALTGTPQQGETGEMGGKRREMGGKYFFWGEPADNASTHLFERATRSGGDSQLSVPIGSQED